MQIEIQRTLMKPCSQILTAAQIITKPLHIKRAVRILCFHGLCGRHPETQRTQLRGLRMKNCSGSRLALMRWDRDRHPNITASHEVNFKSLHQLSSKPKKTTRDTMWYFLHFYWWTSMCYSFSGSCWNTTSRGRAACAHTHKSLRPICCSVSFGLLSFRGRGFKCTRTSEASTSPHRHTQEETTLQWLRSPKCLSMNHDFFNYANLKWA